MLFSLLILSAARLVGDVVNTVDGSRLTGTIVLIDGGELHLETEYAGTIKIDQAKVASFETDEPVSVRLASGATLSGPVRIGADGTLRVSAPDGTLETNMDRVTQTWRTSARDPLVVQQEKEVAALSRRWVYEANFDLLGRAGNSKEIGFGSSFEANLKGPDDSFRVFGTYEYRERNDSRSADRILGGAEYENFFTGIFGWYVRTQMETDRIRQFDFRSTSGAGMSYRLINSDTQSLVLRSGFGYEYTSFTNNDPDASEGTFDFGLAHRKRMNDRFLLRNNVTVVPTMDDIGDYRAVHESSLEFPIGTSKNWSVRSGILNEYESRPAAAKRLDTTYFSRMVLRWE